MRTAFVARPAEYGLMHAQDAVAEPGCDLAVRDLGELADRLGA
jgi:hypothetical protein